ncbi:MAG TPA: DUF4242 domain-containing protein [Chitinophagaceae bacterium]|jgi:uncharacterized protein DUF4242|nr:DUF4242 domain-containing protein [Chitinophagaceae bacterium]
MKKFIVERNLPGAGNLTPEELQAISQAFCDAIGQLGKSYHWIESYITNDRIYCVHIAENECDVREHAKLGNLPINTVNEVITIIDPLTTNILTNNVHKKTGPVIL